MKVQFFMLDREQPINRQERQFHDFVANNPESMALFAQLADQMRENRERYSSKTLIEAMRWHHDVKTTGDDFKINNNYHAYFARWYLEVRPLCASRFFELRSVLVEREQAWELTREEYDHLRRQTSWDNAESTPIEDIRRAKAELGL